MVDNIIKNFEEIIKSEKELWEKSRPLLFSIPKTEILLDPIKGAITSIIEEKEKLFDKYKELLNLVISDKSLTLEQKLQIFNYAKISKGALVKSFASIMIMMKRSNDDRKDRLFQKSEEIGELFSKCYDEIDREVKESYWDLQDKFIQKFGKIHDPIIIGDSYTGKFKIRSFSGHVDVTDEGENKLSVFKSVEIILKALKLNSDETKEEKIN